MKIRSVGDKSLHADGWTDRQDRHDEAKSLCNFAKASKTNYGFERDFILFDYNLSHISLSFLYLSFSRNISH